MSDAAQRLFEQYAADAATPHAGEHFKEFVRSLLMRATEYGCYLSPEVVQARADELAARHAAAIHSKLLKETP